MPKLIDLVRELEAAISNAAFAARLAYDSGQEICLTSKNRRAADTHDYALDQVEILTTAVLNLVAPIVSHPDLRCKP